MQEVVIVDGIRTPIGKYGGGLASVRPDDLLAHTVKRIIGKSSTELVLEIAVLIKQEIPGDYPWPGNVRELEQCIRRILLKKHYEGDTLLQDRASSGRVLDEALAHNTLTAQQLLTRYCKLLYSKLGTYEAVAKRVELDRRTVKKYIDS